MIKMLLSSLSKTRQLVTVLYEIVIILVELPASHIPPPLCSRAIYTEIIFTYKYD